MNTTKRRRAVSAVAGICSVILLGAGVGLLGWYAWQLWGTTWTVNNRRPAQVEKIRSDWQEGSDLPDAAIGLLRAPAMSGDELPIRSGTTPGVLADGLGWYPETASPGRVGNFAVAGHRVTHGEPFRHLTDLAVGDEITVETATEVYTYTVTGSATVDQSEGWVLDPVPGSSGAPPDHPRITLTTCADLYRSPVRYVVFGELSATHHK